MMDATTTATTSTSQDSSDDLTLRLDSDNNDQRLYCVPLRWWKDAQDSSGESDGKTPAVLYMATPGTSYLAPMKLINNIFNSDLLFNLKREGDSLPNGNTKEVGVSGRDYALVPGEMWLKALKWHTDSKVATKTGKGFSAAEEDMTDVYPLQLRLSILKETNSLGVKISKKDNSAELFRRACKIFSIEQEQLHIWDFSGQTTLYFENEKNKSFNDCQRQSEQEILLELQVYGMSDFMKSRDGKREETSHCNGINSSGFWGKSGEAGSLGLTGLQNLGNTCFMNSSLQCLVHTPKLVDFFLGEYGREINHDNPLGMGGEIALAFGDLLRKLWAPGASTVAPRTFKAKLARFASQFSGFNQHDSQELLAFLLDGLHEDLNRVKSKPYVEAKDAEGRLDEEVADEYWRNHLARNDSIIVDVCQGQYKSTLVCPICKKVSVTFDPFMYLSLPLPSTTRRTMTLTVVATNGTNQPSPHTVTVPKFGKFQDLLHALASACSLKEEETLLVAEIYNNKIIRFLEDPSDSLSLIRDDDQLVAYRLTKDIDEVPYVVFTHQKMEELSILGKQSSNWKAVGIPLVARLSNIVTGSDIHRLYLKMLDPFQRHNGANKDTSESTVEETTETKDVSIPVSSEEKNISNVDGVDSHHNDITLQFYLTDERGNLADDAIRMDEPLVFTGVSKSLNILVKWPGKEIEQYDTLRLSSLPEIYKPGFFTKRPQETVSLYKCLEAFLTEEPLGPEDMWFCPGCKKHEQAVKKLDLWRLPEILVIHLKRFSYSRFMKHKLETYVDFPIDDLDLSPYIRKSESSNRYMLYAISNHYGSMGGGHYTAFVHHGGDRWYDFDDSYVHLIGPDKIKTSAAYVLFYRRVVEG